MNRYLVVAVMWLTTLAAVVYGIHETSSLVCLWAFLLPFLATGGFAVEVK